MKANILYIIKGYISNIINISKNKANKSSLTTLYGSAIDLNVSITPGSKYASVTGSASLAGNIIRLYFLADRSANSGAGDVTNEDICTFTITNPNGLIGGYLNTGGTTGGTGGLGVYYTTVDSITSSTIKLRVRLAATHAAINEFNGTVAIPVRLNVPL